MHDLSHLTIAQQDELLKLLEMRAAEGAVDSLAEYAKLILSLQPARHHLLLIDALESIERGELDMLLVMMPPGSAKSTYSSILFPAWYLGRNPTKCIIAASHTQELADRFGRKVRNIVMGGEHSKVFPKFKLSSDSQAAGRWETSVGGEYYAAGVGGSVTGRRADIALIDDPVRSREDADSETVRQKQWDWWRDDLVTRLKPNAAVILIMTRWHEDDLAGRMLEDLKGSSQRIRIIKLPMLAVENDALGRAVGEPLWPEWFTPQMLERAQLEPRTWTALYQQEPRPIGGGELKVEWLPYWMRQPATGQKVILVDPSSGKYRTRGDYTSMWVVGVGADGNEYVLDGIRDRLNLTERTETLFSLVRKYKPAAVGYEQYGLQSDIEHIRIEQERQQYRFRIIELGGSTKKEDRIRRLIPSFQQGRLWVPQSMVRTMSDGTLRDIMDDFRDEYTSFPVGAHDDALDCLARKEDAEIKKYLVSPKIEQEPFLDSWQPLDDEMNY